jgi:GH15 family glucan-1,4-alpha-glucosidase
MSPLSHLRARLASAIALIATLAAPALADPAFISHVPSAQVFGEASGITSREPELPREDEIVDLWVKVGPSFTYNFVSIYFTLDGSDPVGSNGTAGNPTTSVLNSNTGGINFVRNQPNGFGGNDDWWKATVPATAQSLDTRTYGRVIKYRVAARDNDGPEVFVGGGPGTVFTWANKLAWPGQGSAFVNHTVGYPPVWNWKEEAVVGNNNINVQLDQNGSVYDIYYPSAGTVQGISTKNEGYVDGVDTFPAGLPLGFRGQMHLNQAFAGIRVDDKTYWLTNQTGADFTDLAQAYLPGTNTVQTTQRLIAAGNNITVQQVDFAPKGIAFPNTDAAQPNKGIYVKRLILTNNGATAEDVNVYFYYDPALNGGDNFDGLFTDPARGALVAFDNTQRLAGNVGEYNPTTFANYDKNVSVYLAAVMKVCSSLGSATGTPAVDFSRDTSNDSGQGWVGAKVSLNPGQTREVNIAFVGGFDNFAGAAGTYAFQMDGPIDWFQSTSMAAIQTTTDTYWTNWLNSGVTVDLPETAWETLFNRGLLTTALHLDEKNGGVIAGYHNGAYPFVWPRDAVYAAVTLARTAHTSKAREVYRFLRDICYRDSQTFTTGYTGRAFWYQKYTTDGYRVWTAPQVDETAVYPWGIKFQYDVEGDLSFLQSHYLTVYEAGLASSEDSTIDSRLRYEDSVNLMYANNVWEDSFDVFIYSNANVVRGLRDAADIAQTLGNNADVATFTFRRNAIQTGLDARLDWNGENTDISQLGIVYPFETHSPTSPRAKLVMDRINGVANDRFGNNKPLMNFTGEFQNLLDRYWCDSYWKGNITCNLGQPTANPWFLSTLWYGLFYAERANLTPGKGDIDNHKLRVDLSIQKLGPIGLGAEQIAPSSSLLYPGQNDFRLQAAWPNAWESMSTFVDAVMALLDFSPYAPGDRFSVSPKLPTGWPSMTFNNLKIGPDRVSVTASENSRGASITYTNLTGQPITAQATIRVPANSPVCAVTVNGTPAVYTYDAALGSVQLESPLATGVNALTVFRVDTKRPADLNADNAVNVNDLTIFLGAFGSAVPANTNGDLNGDGLVNVTDLTIFLGSFGAGPC